MEYDKLGAHFCNSGRTLFLFSIVTQILFPSTEIVELYSSASFDSDINFKKNSCASDKKTTTK